MPLGEIMDLHGPLWNDLRYLESLIYDPILPPGTKISKTFGWLVIGIVYLGLGGTVGGQHSGRVFGLGTLQMVWERNLGQNCGRLGVRSWFHFGLDKNVNDWTEKFWIPTIPHRKDLDTRITCKWPPITICYHYIHGLLGDRGWSCRPMCAVG